MAESFIPDFGNLVNQDMTITSPVLATPVVTESKPKRTHKKKEDSNQADVVTMPTLSTYDENLAILKNTVGELEVLAMEFKSDLDQVRTSRALKGKHQYASLIGQNLLATMNAKIAAVREMDNIVKSANELDYKMAKDRREMEAANANDDKKIMDLYSAFISAPYGSNQITASQQNLLTNTGINVMPALPGSVANADAMYQNYLNNMTPEQNLMRLETNPNIKEVVVYNQSTGEKRFDIIDMSTGQSVPNVPRKGNIFLEDTTIDPTRGIARNINLGETYPLIVTGELVNNKGL